VVTAGPAGATVVVVAAAAGGAVVVVVAGGAVVVVVVVGGGAVPKFGPSTVTRVPIGVSAQTRAALA
jgi:hypothetical protein